VFDQDPLVTPFGSFEWCSAWLRHWGEGGVPWVLVVYDEQRIAGLAPFVLNKRAGTRLLRGMGVGVGNFWDVIAAPSDKERVVGEVAQTLARLGGEWDALLMDRLPEESSTQAALAQAGLRLGPPARRPSPRIALPNTFDDYLAGLSKNRRSQVRRNLRIIDEGRLTVRSISDPGELRDAITRWQRLRVQWWSNRGGGMDPEHGSERFLAFTTEAITAMVPRGLAVVSEARYDEEPIGVTIDFLDTSTFYYWLWGFDPGCEHLRPGHTLIAHGIRWSIETGRRYYDFMFGDESYKYDYAPIDRAVLSMTIGSPRVRSRAVVGLSALRHAATSGHLRLHRIDRRD
jgi:CelD/BcsL family acetyltransferase involved in cellulose biosynthesis